MVTLIYLPRRRWWHRIFKRRPPKMLIEISGDILIKLTKGKTGNDKGEIVKIPKKPNPSLIDWTDKRR